MASSQHWESGDIRDRPGSPRTKVSWPAASAAVATRLQARIMSNCTARGGKAGGQQGQGHSEWGALPFWSLCLHPVGLGAWRVRPCTWGSGGPGGPSGEPQRWGRAAVCPEGPCRVTGCRLCGQAPPLALQAAGAMVPVIRAPPAGGHDSLWHLEKLCAPSHRISACLLPASLSVGA